MHLAYGGVSADPYPADREMGISRMQPPEGAGDPPRPGVHRRVDHQPRSADSGVTKDRRWTDLVRSQDLQWSI